MFKEHCSNIYGDILQSIRLFSETTFDVITFLICKIQDCKNLQNEKRYSKKQNAILFYIEKPFYNQQLSLTS